MARLRGPATPDTEPRMVTCNHPRIAGPKTMQLCDPRVILIQNLDADIAEQARAAYADHHRDGNWPGTLEPQP